MYSASSVAVDKGLGFDFSDITDLVKTALPVGLNIFNQQMQLRQVRALSASGYPAQSPGVYGQSFGGQLPLTSYLQPQPTFGGRYVQPSSGMSSTSMALIGAATLVVGLLAFKLFR